MKRSLCLLASSYPRVARLCLAGLAAIGLGACSPSFGTSPLGFGDATGVYTAGNIRMVTERNRVQPATGHVLSTLCTEPSPDYAIGFNQNAKILATLEKLGGGSLDLTSNEAVTPLEGRSAGVLALRDGLYAACQSYANGIIGHDAYALILSQYGDALVDLMNEPEAAASTEPPAPTPDDSKGGTAGKKVPDSQKKATSMTGGAALYDAVLMDVSEATHPSKRHAAATAPKSTASTTAAIAAIKARQAAHSAILVSCISEHDPTRMGGEEFRPKNPMLSVSYCQKFMKRAIARRMVTR